MSKWFGEQKEWTDNEKSFMVKAAFYCTKRQAAGSCEWGSKACCQCKWQAPMAAIKELDSFTQSRIEDKADMLKLIEDSANAQCDRELARTKRANVCLVIIAAVVVAAVAFCLSCCCSTGVTKRAESPVPLELDGKWHTLPPKPVDSEWSCYEPLQRAMAMLKDRRNVKDWTGEGVVNCRDWTMAFLVNWYLELEQPDGTCFVVWNDDYTFFEGNSWSHMFVAVWSGSSWLMVEPQAFSRSSWLVKDYWGRKYDERKNIYNMTTEAVSDMVSASWQLRKKIVAKTKSEDFYGNTWWKGE